MRTRKISLFYNVTRTEIIPPPSPVLVRKDAWLKELQASVEADWAPRIVKLTYEIFNPEVEQQRKFFNGPVVEYYAIQNDNLTSGEMAPERKKRYREQILDELLGFDVHLVNRVVRRRKSTGDFRDTQVWHDFLEELREALFDPNGYEFPDSKAFWELAEKVGYDQAKDVATKQLQEKLKRKLAP